MATTAVPDFLIIGAPSAGAATLEATLGQHPQVFGSTADDLDAVLADDFAGAEPGQVRGATTPYLLSDAAAHRRLAAALPEVRLLAVLRDPVERAHEHWLSLRASGQETEQDFGCAVETDRRRTATGIAPGPRYLELGRYGEQLESLYEHVDPRRTMILRHRDFVEAPQLTLDRACDFLGIDTGLVPPRPVSDPASPVPQDRREALLATFEDDVRLLRRITGQDFSGWLPASVHQS